MAMSNMLKGDPNPKNYEQMYLDLLDLVDNIGFRISLDMKNLKQQYLADKQANAEMLSQRYDEQQKASEQQQKEQNEKTDSS